MTEHQIYHFSHADIWLAAHPQYEIFGLYHSPGITELGDSDHLRGMDGDLYVFAPSLFPWLLTIYFNTLEMLVGM